MIIVRPGDGRSGSGWQMVARTPMGADVVARAHPAEPPARLADGAHSSWRPALERLRDGDGRLTIGPGGDGHLMWTLTEPDGCVVAESPPVYRDADSCRRGFRAAQQAARVALGGSRHRTAWPATGRSPR
jgi:hypothetical protein